MSAYAKMPVTQVTHICHQCGSQIEIKQEFQNLTKLDVSSLIDNIPSRSDPANQSTSIFPFKNSKLPHPVYKICTDSCLDRIVGNEDDDEEEEAISFLHSFQDDDDIDSSLDHQIKVSSYLFNVLSGRTKVDHPMCFGCADRLIGAKRKELEHHEDELTNLQDYLKFIETPTIIDHTALVEPSIFTDPSLADDDPSVSSPSLPLNSFDNDDREDDWKSCCSESPTVSVKSFDYHTDPSSDVHLPLIDSGCSIGWLEIKLEKLRANLERARGQFSRLDNELIPLLAELKDKTDQLDRATLSYNERKLTLLETERDLGSLEARFTHASWHLLRLNCANLLTILFSIRCDASVGQINGLSLGRLSTRPVEWEEINAAWGQCALLLQLAARKANFKFENYSATPLGSQSLMIKGSNQKEYPLFHAISGFTRLGTNKFNLAMIAYLDCVRELANFLQLQLPYTIMDHGLIRDSKSFVFTVKFNSGSEEKWTKALKLMLLNLKQLIAGLSNLPRTRNASSSINQST